MCAIGANNGARRKEDPRNVRGKESDGLTGKIKKEGKMPWPERRIR